MTPSECISFLLKHPFLRNPPLNELCESPASINLSDYLCFCVGTYESRKAVYVIRIMSKTPSPGVGSYEIIWYHPLSIETLSHNEIFTSNSIRFWVHSGVSLRKCFFFFSDKMSLPRSGFIYDPVSGKFFRLSSIVDYIHCNERNPVGEKIYRTIDLWYTFRKIKYPINTTDELRDKIFKRKLEKFLLRENQFNYVADKHPGLFEEINEIINH